MGVVLLAALGALAACDTADSELAVVAVVAEQDTSAPRVPGNLLPPYSIRAGQVVLVQNKEEVTVGHRQRYGRFVGLLAHQGHVVGLSEHRRLYYLLQIDGEYHWAQLATNVKKVAAQGRGLFALQNDGKLLSIKTGFPSEGLRATRLSTPALETPLGRMVSPGISEGLILEVTSSALRLSGDGVVDLAVDQVAEQGRLYALLADGARRQL